MEKALIYEMIIRRANNCGRYGVAGADADIFRHLDSVWAKGFDGNYRFTEIERGVAIGEVSAFLRDAFERLVKSNNLTEEKTRSLQTLRDKLLHPNLEIIDQVVEDAANILQLL